MSCETVEIYQRSVFRVCVLVVERVSISTDSVVLLWCVTNRNLLHPVWYENVPFCFIQFSVKNPNREKKPSADWSKHCVREKYPSACCSKKVSNLNWFGSLSESRPQVGLWDICHGNDTNWSFIRQHLLFPRRNS